VKLAEQTVKLSGGEIHYRAAGDGGGAPVVWLHGAGGYRHDPRVFAGLAEHYQLLLPSMPGFDASMPGSTQNVQDIADAMAEFIQQVAGGQALVIGESFGGGVACWLAIRHPEVVDRLILAAPAGLRQEGGPRLTDLTPAEAAVLLYGRAPTEQASPEEQQRRTHNRQNAARIGSARPGFDPDLFDQLTAVRAPTLVLWGSADRMIWPAQAQHFVGQIPGATLVMIDGAPHVLSAAVPEEFLAPVLDFLRPGVRAG
jgi:pimeloyl-ACP methyl ester carboxylesterase